MLYALTKVMSIYEMALRIDGPNIKPALSPYPSRTRPAVLAGNPPRSPQPTPKAFSPHLPHPAVGSALQVGPPPPIFSLVLIFLIANNRM